LKETATLNRLGEAGALAVPLHKLTWKDGSHDRLEHLLSRLEPEWGGARHQTSRPPLVPRHTGDRSGLVRAVAPVTAYPSRN
jgi:hypothetical protein